MELKNKFDNYQTEVDAEAWEHFQMLRSNQRSKKRFFWWFFFSGIALVGIISLAFWKFKQPSIRSNESISNIEGISNIINDHTTTIKNNTQQKVITSKNESPTLIEKNAIVIDQIITKSINSKGSNFNKNTASPDENLSITTTNQTNLAEQNNLASNKNRQNTNTLKGIELNEKLINNEISTTANEKELKNRKASIAANIKSPILQLIPISDTVEAINFTSLPPLTKPLKRQKNTLKFGVNFADAIINGFSLENPVNKQGPALQLEYYHEWNKIIGTGISAGYVKTVDRNNPSFVIKDRETIKFLHANLYLFLLNENKHKLYAKIGGGLTNTDRVLGTFLLKANGEVERTFQINNITGLGFLVEGAYEYKLNKSFIIGANYSIISHNDGAWFTGLSIGYQF